MTTLNSKTTAWNLPELEESAAREESRRFLTAEHSDSWSPAWTPYGGQSSAAVSSYDFFMA